MNKLPILVDSIPSISSNFDWLTYSYVPLDMETHIESLCREDLTLERLRREHVELVDKLFAEIAESAKQLNKLERVMRYSHE